MPADLPAGSPSAGRVTRTASYLLAFVVHLLAPAFLLIGVYLVTRLVLPVILYGLVALDLAWLLRPRPAAFPASAVPLTRPDAPHLYALIDRIGAELGAPRTDLIAISGKVNASFGTYGWRRGHLLEIGYPLWAILGPQERVALLAHEMAHSGNGDARHGLVVGSALHSLHRFRGVTAFGWRAGDGLSALVTESLLAVLGVPVRALGFLLELLVNHSSRQTEYRADEMQAQVAGRTAAASLLDVLTTRSPSVGAFLRSSGVAVGTDGLWTALRSLVDGIPETELERHREAARAEKTRVDRTHPPTYLRMRRVLELPYPEPRIPAPNMEQIETELTKPAVRVARILREDAQSALYR
jgi:Zn-dependent protease with chaperone function